MGDGIMIAELEDRIASFPKTNGVFIFRLS